MRKLLDRLHAKMGDLWWYSLMIFIACRSGDVIQAFIGLWLVPKYVGTKELGAVLPLQQLTTFLTVPLGVVAIVFSKQVNTYAAHGEYGKVKGLIRDVLVISSVLFLICIGGAYVIMPFFYERLNVAPGLLTALILAGGLVGAFSSLVGAAQQGLKRFKPMSILNLISAPIRLVTLLFAMPIRPLSGYMLGQTTPGFVTATLAAYDIKKALALYTPDHTWRKDWKPILQYTWPITINTILTTICGAMCLTVYRQRLPEIESGAFYLITRFTDVTTFIGCAIFAVLFPLASEAHEKGEESSKLVIRTAFTLFFLFALMTGGVAFTHSWLFSLISTWATYQAYSHLLPVIMFYSGCGVIITGFTTYEMACRRFGALFWILATNVAWVGFLVTFTGAEFFRGKLPNGIVDWMVSIHAARLDFLSYLAMLLLLIQLSVSILIFYHNQRRARACVTSLS